MSVVLQYPHLTIGEDGVARIGQTRYKVLHLATEHYHYGWTAEELLRQHPDLKPEEVYAALTYFYDHFQEMIQQMSPPPRPQVQSVSRDELLKLKPFAAS